MHALHPAIRHNSPQVRRSTVELPPEAYVYLTLAMLAQVLEARMLVGAMEGQDHRFEIVWNDDSYLVQARDIGTGIARGMAGISCRTAAMAFACAETHAAFERWAAARAFGTASGMSTIAAFIEFAETRGRAGALAAALGETDALSHLPNTRGERDISRPTFH